MIAAGATVHDLAGFFGSVRVRYFGEKPLTEDDSVRSDATVLVNAEAGYEFNQRCRLTLSAFNLRLEDHDIDYFYASRLLGEPADGVEDLHFHPVEPAQLRLALTVFF
ncbi:MAG: hypothetical protein ACREXT_08770 [Gammaproteobacteria bacterium]